jgi:two-component system, response regulator PdtaR
VVILIVEDEFLIGWALKLMLHLAGHHAVGPAASAEEALQLAQAEQPELAFVDISIAGDQDGIAVARMLTEEHGVSCIFLTAQPDRARMAKDAALGVVTKPYDPRQLLQMVDFTAAIRGGQLLPTVPRQLELFHQDRRA